MSALEEFLATHRKRIISGEKKTFRQMASAYELISEELNDSINQLQRKIERAKAKGETINRNWLNRQKRLEVLLEQSQDQIERFGNTASRIISTEQSNSIRLGIEYAQESLRLRADTVIRDAGFFNPKISTQAVENAVGFMGNGTPLKKYFAEQLAPAVAKRIKQEVIKGVALRKNFNSIAKNLRDAGGITRQRALTTARTEVLRVYRETTRQIYEENSDIVTEWEWAAAKSARTCVLCLAMDGKRFPVSELMPNHVNDRCVMLPVTRLSRPRKNIGSNWFEKQDDKTKRKILGKEGFTAYRSGDVALDDFVAFKQHKLFGKSVARKPLAQVLSEKRISTK